MKRMKNICTLALCVLLTFCLVIPAFAKNSTVTYQGKKDGFDFAPGSTYTASDLFDNMKDVMPGDTRSETVTIINEAKSCDYIAVYMGALLHDSEDNPISPAVLEALTEDERRGTMSELEYMHDFLKQLELRVWKDEKKAENLIYAGHPDSLEDGFEEGNVYLGSLGRGQSMKLPVELAVDIEMGNEFADRIGEVDWVFVVEERYEDNEPDYRDPTPDKKPDTPDGPVDVVEDMADPSSDVPGEVEEDGFHLNVLPLTGDETMIWPFVIVGLLALIGLVVLIKGRRKEEK